MGTNYYAIPKVDEQKKKEIIENIITNDFKAAIDLIPKEIHIGKSSAGWRFLFNHNNWTYFKDYASLKDFLLNASIFDEYNRLVSFRDFWYMVSQKEEHREGGQQFFGLSFSDNTEFS